MRALIVGGGIGGLTAAISLRRAGAETTVFERTSEIKEARAGLLLGANAVKALGKLGLMEAVRETGVPTTLGGELRSWRGETLVRLSAPEMREAAGTDSLAVHRADLQRALLNSLGGETVRLGAECAGFEQDADGVRVFLSGGGEEHGDLLVGADGLYSEIRAGLFGAERPRYAGYTAWRGVAGSGEGLLPRGEGFESWGRGARFGCAPVGSGRIYWFATRNAPGGKDDEPAGSRARLLEIFRGWHEPVEALIQATGEPAILHNDIYDREPTGRWSAGRTTLLGDAAHPMTPNLGQGACQAIEDAVVLARCVDEDDVPAAVELYEARRADRTAEIVRLSRRLGRVGQWENPLLCRLRDAAMKRLPERVQRRQIENVLGYEV